ncbi:MAG: hypothetical protein K6E13_12065 [Lachnospiraceae bacterium]|nr:hypothetical protein [Lachnospiraceae bacterium]
MGRPGGGGGGRSGGGHSMGRSSGGHRVGGSSGGSRPGAGSYGRSSGGRRGPVTYGRGRAVAGGSGLGYGAGGGLGCGCGTLVLICFMVAFVAIAVAAFSGNGSGSSYTSTVVREKLTNVPSFDSNCVVDELGWFDSTSATASGLKNFYDQTGVQPYLVFLDYDSSYSDDASREAYANEYYEENISSENVFLYIYFAEQDSDNDMGYMCYVAGNQADTVMDSEAVNIFWNYIDDYWYSDLSMDDMIVTVFDRTAENIMAGAVEAKNTGYMKYAILIIVLVIILAVVIYYIIKEKNRRAKEKAKETETILNTPLRHVGDEGDDLIDKYTSDSSKDSEDKSKDE